MLLFDAFSAFNFFNACKPQSSLNLATNCRHSKQLFMKKKQQGAIALIHIPNFWARLAFIWVSLAQSSAYLFRSGFSFCSNLAKFNNACEIDQSLEKPWCGLQLFHLFSFDTLHQSLVQSWWNSLGWTWWALLEVHLLKTHLLFHKPETRATLLLDPRDILRRQLNMTHVCKETELQKNKLG